MLPDKMNLKLYITCIAAVLIFAGPAAADSTATIHGVVYGWDTFDPLDNAVVEVNSTPSQSMVAKYGLYSFELVPGDYVITAKYYQNSTLIYSAEEPITIEGEGNYVLDLLLLPVYSEELMDSSASNGFSESQNESAGNAAPSAETDKDEASGSEGLSDNASTAQNGYASSIGNYLFAALMLTLLLVGGYRFSRKPKNEDKEDLSVKKEASKTEIVSGSEILEETPEKAPETEFKMPEQISSEQKSPEEIKIMPMKHETGSTEPEAGKETKETAPEEIANTVEPEPAPKKKIPLPSDLQEVMDIIRGQGGRITQKELRKRLKYSEGKVSLMLADLEKRELIEKFKRGRGNVVILKDEQR